MSALICPLCGDGGDKPQVAARVARRYLRCDCCKLIYLNPTERLALADERAYYATHENSIDDAGYVAFLRRLLDPVLPWLKPTWQGLDYGCGPGPTMSKLLAQQGIHCDDYDPAFFPITLKPQYDFILASECFEHFHQPDVELKKLTARLKPGGILGIMTDRWRDEDQFYEWHYTRDPTHCSFFHLDSFHWLCERFQLRLRFHDERRVVILQKLPDAVAGNG
ncbi:class I SAM-dependent methyltransferase [Shewanella yunxiaonensis]|uniref:Class I SAM-dependent methyltransferase n=1 Tax=Shewanella yunxiaonensis TaxID=2829809 RepID=A0ABX7YRW1_9GAMM|nr:class I SAM-dependent methyltransferase [Shewanella yunxiaonensis]QUN05477.1 class I SAM-dependent methyltransferase [Shewanella yunxiaonensis]